MLLNTQDSLKKLKTKQQPDVVTKTAVPNAPLASEANKEIQSQDSNKTIPDDMIVPSETKQEDLNKTITDDVKLPQDNTKVIHKNHSIKKP